ncbi:hypothetical protein KUTeg_012968 [Tegillarca granosa]|uniref:TauD/TfdA-like domain-containing protein n=1 Tax=Tegillarca granosa TaxID=220873 RepID=A0ABQ9ESB3_TEGGR|nr:hypothetical protein KUTeg_012968 [Tegillarca granosa]
MAFVPKCGRHVLKLMSTCRSHSLQHTIRKGTFVLDSYSLTFREFSSLFHLNSDFIKGNIHTKKRKSRLYDPISTCSNGYATETTSIDDSGKLVTVSLGDGSQSKWLRHMNDYGLCLIKDVPNENFIVVKIAEYIAPVVNNVSYGDRFEVLSIPDPSNVAYSTEGLYFHCDLPYYESPPGLQFLHCLQFDSCVEGGATTFLDAFHVAEKFRQEHPADFDALTRIPIVGVYWAAAIEDALSVPAGDVETYYRAYHKFAAAIKYSPVIREHKLQPGDLIVFNNRRFLHGRNSFNLNGGVRHFQGCYINSDEYKSKLSVLSNQLGDNRPIFHCGNQSW